MSDADAHSFNIPGADLYLLVGPNNAPFRIHSFFLISESEWWRNELIGNESSPDAPLTQGNSPTSPYVLEDVLPEAFRILLKLFYNPKYGSCFSDFTLTEWMVILYYAHKWEFQSFPALVSL